MLNASPDPTPGKSAIGIDQGIRSGKAGQGVVLKLRLEGHGVFRSWGGWIAPQGFFQTVIRGILTFQNGSGWNAAFPPQVEAPLRRFQRGDDPLMPFFVRLQENREAGILQIVAVRDNGISSDFRFSLRCSQRGAGDSLEIPDAFAFAVCPDSHDAGVRQCRQSRFTPFHAHGAAQQTYDPGFGGEILGAPIIPL